MNPDQAQKILTLTNNSYEKIAGEFSITRQSAWPEIDFAVKKYLKNDDKILDLGCGNGRLLLSLQKTNLQNLDYTGIDNSSTLITKAQDIFFSSHSLLRRGEVGGLEIKFIKQDILSLSNFSDNSFDIVFNIASFNHIPSCELRQKVLNEIYRILKPGGKIIMTNWNLWNLKNKKSIWQARKTWFDHGNFPWSNHVQDIMTLWQNKHPLYYRAFTKSELKKLFKKSNFKILENKFVKDGKSAHWWNGKNILTIGEKM